MANEEQLAILRQGVEVWNKWRGDNLDILIDLSKADLRGVDLTEAYLWTAHLEGANLSEACLNLTNLAEADVRGVDFKRADLRQVNLNKASLGLADFSYANLSGAELNEADFTESVLGESNLSNASLVSVILRGTHLSAANLTGANLRGAFFWNANLHKTDFSKACLYGAFLSTSYLDESNFSLAEMGGTNLGNLDLSQVIGLEQVIHNGPSNISTVVFTLSEGKIPEDFLRGCGLSDWEIEHAKLYNPDLNNDDITQIQYKVYDLRATQALQVSPLFISYNHSDKDFVNKIANSLTERGIRYWRDVFHATAGRLETQIDRSMRLNPTVLLILSKHSIKSDWVEHEVRTARELEKEMKRDVLCPVALDDSWKSSRWPKRVMEQIMEYNILDFSGWEDDVKFEGMFRKLIDGLELFYKG
jgi:uncharacterized protein YjbI with pentapeptide repeats